MSAALARLLVVVWSIVGARGRRLSSGVASDSDAASDRAQETFNPKPVLFGALMRPPTAPLPAHMPADVAYGLAKEFPGPARSASGPFPPRSGALSRIKNPFQVSKGQNLVQDYFPWRLEAQEEISRGTRGVVWRCRLTTDEGIDEDVAVKVENLFKEVPDGVLTRSKAMREVEMLNHFNGGPFVDYYGFWERRGSILIITGLADASLRAMLQQPFEEIDLPLRVAMFTELMDGLRRLAELNFAHRSIWPGNLLVKAEGNELHIKIADFGHACSLKRNRDLLWGHEDYVHTRIGAPLYRAPEGWSGRWTSKSDVYSAGLVLYNLLFEGDLPPSQTDKPFGHPEFNEEYSKYDVRKDEWVSSAKAMAQEDPGLLQLLDVLEKMLSRDEAERASSEDVFRALSVMPTPSPNAVTTLRVAKRLHP